MVATSTVELVISWSFSGVALAQNHWVVASSSIIGNLIAMLARWRSTSYAFGLLQRQGDPVLLKSLSRLTLRQLYAMTVLTFECVVLMPWRPTRHQAASSSGFANVKLLLTSLWLAVLQGCWSLAVQAYYLVYDLSTESKVGPFLRFSIAVGGFALLWRTTMKVWTLCLWSRMADFTPSDAFADEDGPPSRLTPVPMRLAGDGRSKRGQQMPVQNPGVTEDQWVQNGAEETKGQLPDFELYASLQSPPTDAVGTAFGKGDNTPETAGTSFDIETAITFHSPFSDLNVLRSQDGNVAPFSQARSYRSATPSTSRLQLSEPLPPPSGSASSIGDAHVAPSPLPPPSAVMADEAETPMDRVAPPSAVQVHLDLDDHGLGHIVNTPAGDLVRRLHIGYDAHQQDKFVGGGGNGCMY